MLDKVVVELLLEHVAIIEDTKTINAILDFICEGLFHSFSRIDIYDQQPFYSMLFKFMYIDNQCATKNHIINEEQAISLINTLLSILMEYSAKSLDDEESLVMKQQLFIAISYFYTLCDFKHITEQNRINIQNCPQYVPFLQEIIQKFDPSAIRMQFIENMNNSLAQGNKDKDEFNGMLSYQFKYCANMIGQLAYLVSNSSGKQTDRGSNFATIENRVGKKKELIGKRMKISQMHATLSKQESKSGAKGDAVKRN